MKKIIFASHKIARVFSCFFCLLFFVFNAGIFAQDFASGFYWDTPKNITNVDSRFPKVASSENKSYVFFQEVDTKSNEIYISYVKPIENSSDFSKQKHVAGPFSYSGEIPDIYSCAINKKGVLAVAVMPSSRVLSVYVSDDDGETFKNYTFPFDGQEVVGPRIFSCSDGKFVLFATSGSNDNFTLYSAESSDGLNWTEFSLFPPTEKFINPFSPHLISLSDGRDLVVFQAQLNYGNRFSYQIYSSISGDNRKTWSDAKLITGNESTNGAVFTNLHNQRPFSYEFDGKIFVTFERNHYTSELSHIWIEQLNSDGSVLIDPLEKPTELSPEGNAHRPILFDFNEKLICVWFDNRSGTETVYVAQKDGLYWSDTKLVPKERGETFSFPLITETEGKKELSFIWQQNEKSRKSQSRIAVLQKDRHVEKPALKAVNFNPSKKSGGNVARVTVTLPADPSGIAGFSWIFTQDENEEVPKLLMNLPDKRQIQGNATEDGKWFFKVRAQDYAGNWSEEEKITFTRDTTAPKKPKILPIEPDENGFLPSNTFSIKWEKDEEDDNDVAGYTWALTFVSSNATGFPEGKKSEGGEQISQRPDVKTPLPPRYSQGLKTSVSYNNYRNGRYAFSVCAIDSVGNISESETVFFDLNKYKPSTKIYAANGKADDFGVTNVTILGQGFNYDGKISKIYISKNGRAPYDREFSLENGDFTINNDERISNLKIKDLDEGTYRLALQHPERGTTISGNILKITQSGTIKFETEYIFEPDWRPILAVEQKYQKIDNWKILLCLVLLISALAFVATLRSLVVTAKEAVIIEKEVSALLTGGTMAIENKEKLNHLKAKGTSLSVKIVMFSVALVLLSVAMASLPLSYLMTKNQERTLSENLYDKINVVLESISTGVKAYLPTENTLELSYLPGYSETLDELEWATITGLSSSDSQKTNLDFVWATNDGEIASKIDTETLDFGKSRLQGDEIQEIIEKCKKMNEEAIAQGAQIAEKIVVLNSEGRSLALKSDKNSLKRIEEVQNESRMLTENLMEIFSEIAKNGIGSYPPFDSHNLDHENTKYLFYRPVIFRQGNDQNFVRSVIFAEVTTDNLVTSVKDAQKNILIVSLIIAAIAILIGTIGSIIISRIIVNPIKALARHVEIIGSTKDKMKLAGHEIAVKSKDEIGLLGSTVNEMTRNLVKAATEEKLLMDGKVVQQTFLPLGTDPQGNKMTTAELNDKNLQLFGYYEGASGVSGDYFDYIKLDDNRYAIIKCDASGHGVPAALIMTIVATLFRKYFESWKPTGTGAELKTLVSQINDFIESLGLKGKFATLMICLLDTSVEKVFLCNAGDNIIHFYDTNSKKEKIVTLTETPAAGPLPSFMVDMKGGFVVETLDLKKGDTLFLYTDGIEEATRLFRDSNFQVIKCKNGNEGEIHENHKVGEESEQMEGERINEIIEAVFARSSYTLKKFHNPIADEELVFDFSTCTGKVEDAILALAAVEKVFRFYKNPKFTASDTVKVDRKIDAFLKEHFNRYDFYCANQTDSGDPSYIFYNRLQEDEQLDDLTLLAIRKV